MLVIIVMNDHATRHVTDIICKQQQQQQQPDAESTVLTFL